MNRLEIATHVLTGMCAGDWKFDVKNSTWDEVAAARAIEIADKLIAADKAPAKPVAKAPKLKAVKNEPKKA